jgi:hypothetical protein
VEIFFRTGRLTAKKQTDTLNKQQSDTFRKLGYKFRLVVIYERRMH